MSKEAEIRAISQKLKKDGEFLEDNNFILIEGVKVRYPYCELDYIDDRDFTSSPVVWESKKKLYELFKNNLPQEWISFIKEVGKKRIDAGNSSSLDLIIGVGFTIDENVDYSKSIGLHPYKRDSEGNCDYRDIPNLVKTINTVINDQFLGPILENGLTTQMFDQGTNWDDFNTIGNIYKDLASQGKQILDIGVGIGKKTSERFNETGVKTIGIERQYHPKFYKKYWKNDNPNMQFIRSDADEAIPLQSESIDFVLMECVIPHITLDSLEKILWESARVLKNNGILMVGPEEVDWKNEKYDGESRWRYFVKTDVEGQINLKQIKLEDVSRIIGVSYYEEEYLI